MSPQRRLRISTSAFLYLLSVTETERKRGSRNNQSSSYKRYFYFQTFAFQVMDSDYSELSSSEAESDYEGEESELDISEEVSGEESSSRNLFSMPVPSSSSSSTDTNQNTKRDRDGPSWGGEKLFPPKANALSKVWKLGGLRKVNGILQKDFTQCGVCGKNIKYRGSPTNLQQHLEKLHSIEWGELEMKKHAEQPKISVYSSVSKPKHYPDSHPKQKGFVAKLVSWVVRNLRPVSIVEDDKFQDLIAFIDPQLKVPARNTIMNKINLLRTKKQGEVMGKLKSVTHICCSTDAGSSLDQRSVINVNLHWINDNFEMEKKIISMSEVDGKKASEYRAVVDESLQSHDVQEKVWMFTTDNEPTMNLAFPRYERNGCFSHIQSKSSQKALESSKTVANTRKKLRKVARRINKASKLKSYVKKEQIRRKLSPKTVKQEILTRFECTKTMFRSILNDPNENTEETVDEEKSKENIAALNDAFRAVLPKKEAESLQIKPSEVQVMLNLIPTLDLMSEAINVMGGEKYSTSSATLPWLIKFLDMLQTSEENKGYVNDFISFLRKDLIPRCKKNLNIKVLAKASFLDKRFSKLNFLDKISSFTDEEISKEVIHKEIKEELEAMESPEEEIESERPAKKIRFLSLLCDEESSGGSNPRDEFQSYIRAEGLSSDADPLTWWKQNKSKYPKLAILARKYLAVQSSSTASERVMSLMGNILSKKRLRLTDKNFSSLIYLYDCL